jgi:hypothetical protein
MSLKKLILGGVMALSLSGCQTSEKNVERKVFDNRYTDTYEILNVNDLGVYSVVQKPDGEIIGGSASIDLLELFDIIRGERNFYQPKTKQQTAHGFPYTDPAKNKYYLTRRD